MPGPDPLRAVSPGTPARRQRDRVRARRPAFRAAPGVSGSGRPGHAGRQRSGWRCWWCCSGSARPSAWSWCCTTSSESRSARSRRPSAGRCPPAASSPGGPRQKVADSQGGATFEIGPAEHRQVTEKFIAACASGDLDGLLQVLAPDVWGEFDGGPDDPRARGVTRGAVRVARRLLYFWGNLYDAGHSPGGRAARPARLRRPGAGGRPGFHHADGKIQAVHVIGDPRQLAFVSSQLC